MRNRLKYLKRVFQGTTEDERRDIRDIGNGIELPRASRAIILMVRRIPDPLVLVDNPKRHDDHDVELTDDDADYPLFHQAHPM